MYTKFTLKNNDCSTKNTKENRNLGFIAATNNNNIIDPYFIPFYFPPCLSANPSIQPATEFFIESIRFREAILISQITVFNYLISFLTIRQTFPLAN